MIQWMHRISQSWVASLLMGILAVGFVFWGIADVFTGTSSTAVATVGSTEIDGTTFQRSYRNYLRNQSQSMGTQITPDMAEKMGLGQVALQQLVSRTALDNEVRALHLTTSDAALRQNVQTMPDFRNSNGQFDRTVFQNVLQANGYTEQEFGEELRADLSRDQLTGALEQGFMLPQGYARALYLFITEQRAVNYVVVSPDSVGPIAPPDDATLTAYIKAHPERFSTPEYRQVEYAEIGPADLADQVKVTDAAVSQEYNAHLATYQTPEKRDIQQIEFPTEAEAKTARAALDAGKSFDALAAERKIKPADLVLGELTKSELPDPARADAAFALPINQVSQPVKGAFGGYVLMRVTKIVPGTSHPLSEVQDQIRQSLLAQMAGGKIADSLNAFEDARSGGADIAAAAKKAGMKSGRFVAIDRNGLTPAGQKADGLPADPEFLDAVSKAQEGEDNDPFPAKSGVNYAVKVEGVTPPKLKPLDQVRADAIAAWTEEQKSTALARKAAMLAAEAQADKNLANVAKTLKVPLQQSPALTRQTADTTFSGPLVEKIFTAAPGGIVMGQQGVGTNFIIAQISGISHAAPAPRDNTFQAGIAQMSQQAAQDITVSFANGARLKQGVSVNQKNMQSAMGSGQ